MNVTLRSWNIFNYFAKSSVRALIIDYGKSVF